jgi:hypothetical protein
VKRDERRFDQRAFVVAGALFAGLALPLTGLADHLVGHAGPDALVGWAIAHTALGVLVVVFCAWHVVLNGRALLRRLKAVRTVSRPSNEALVALVLVGAVLAATVTHALLES